MKTYTIHKTSGLSLSELYSEINNGGKFVVYGYCISILALTFRRLSPPFFIRSDEKSSKYRGKYNTLSLIFGWWGLPWGPIYTIDMLKINAKNGGGVDVTEEILSKIQRKYNESDESKTFAEDILIDFDDDELIR